MKNTLITTILIILTLQCVVAQQSDEFIFNSDNYFIDNPSQISLYNEMRIAINHRQTFSGIEKSPRHMFASIQYPIYGQNLSLGGAVLSNRAGLLNENRVLMAASYKIRNLFAVTDYLAVGLSGIMSQLSVDTDDIKVNDLSDPFVSNLQGNSINVNLSIGATYINRRTKNPFESDLLVVGASFNDAVPQRSNLGNLQYDAVYSMKSFASYNFKAGYNVILKPMVDFTFETVAIPSHFVAGANFIFSEKLLLGLSYDSDSTIGLNLGYYHSNQSGSDYNGYSNAFAILFNGGVPVGQSRTYINSGFGFTLQYYMTNNGSKFNRR